MIDWLVTRWLSDWRLTDWTSERLNVEPLPEAKRSVLHSVAIDVIQLSSGMVSSKLPTGLLWAFGTVHKGFFFDTLHNESELLTKWNF